MIAMVISVILSVLLNGNFAKDAPVAVIDLDNSKYSQELITKINASEYMQVKDIIYMPMEPTELFYRDEVLTVIYLPKGLEKNRYSSTDRSIGAFYDNTNTAQTADIQEALNELVALENAQAGMESGAAGASLSLNTRKLFNPAGSTSNGSTQGFLFFFGAMFFTFATIGMVPRLRLTHQLDKILLEGTPWDIILRLVPYGACLVTSYFLP